MGRGALRLLRPRHGLRRRRETASARRCGASSAGSDERADLPRRGRRLGRRARTCSPRVLAGEPGRTAARSRPAHGRRLRPAHRARDARRRRRRAARLRRRSPPLARRLRHRRRAGRADDDDGARGGATAVPLLPARAPLRAAAPRHAPAAAPRRRSQDGVRLGDAGRVSPRRLRTSSVARRPTCRCARRRSARGGADRAAAVASLGAPCRWARSTRRLARPRRGRPCRRRASRRWRARSRRPRCGGAARRPISVSRTWR